MNCPNGCGVLDREDHEDCNGMAIWKGQPYPGAQINSIYHCPDCDFEAIWRKHVLRGERQMEVIFPGIGVES